MPSPFSHVRVSWNRQRYTEAQANELRHLRALYTTHCAPVFGPAVPDAFALQTEGDESLPRYTARSLSAPVALSLPPAAQQAGPYPAFAEGMERALEAFEVSRRQRWYGKGHPNDPLRLLGVFLRNICHTWLRSAVPGENTLAQVTALRQYLEALAQQSVFTDATVTVLLHNLASTLSTLEKENVRVMRLHSAREYFSSLQDGIQASIHHAADFLFHAVADKDRTTLPFSLTNLRAQVVHRKLSQALATREGLVLQSWALSPEERSGSPSAADIAQLPPLLEGDGRVSSVWQALLHTQPSKGVHLDASLLSLPRGISTHLSSDTVEAALRLHGLCALLTQYQTYTTSLWELAGFGGDHCVYDHLQDAVSSILTELRLFNHAFAHACTTLQEQLDNYYKKALATSTSAPWQANYRKAKVAQEKCLAALRRTDTALAQLLVSAQDAQAHAQRSRLALQAHATLMTAPRFLNQARVCVGLPPQAQYPGLEVLPDPFALPLPAAALPLQQTLTLLLSHDPSGLAWLQQLCPATEPWSLFRGTAARYRYVQDSSRLSHLGQHLAYCTEHTASPATSEKRAFIASLRTALQEEQARLIEMRKTLTWPFHRASIRFFATLQQAVAERLQSLEQQEQRELAALARVPIVSPEVPSTQNLLTIPIQRKKGKLGNSIPTGEALSVAALQSLTQETEEEKRQQQEHDAFLLRYTSLSAEDKVLLRNVYQKYHAATSELRTVFDAQKEEYGNALPWDTQGEVRPGLTPLECAAVLRVWARCTMQQADTVFARADRYLESRAFTPFLPTLTSTT